MSGLPSWKFSPDDGNGAPSVTKQGGVNAQPTGATTTGSGHHDKQVPNPQVTNVLPAQAAGVVAAQPDNTWTMQNQSGVHAPEGKIAPWIRTPENSTPHLLDHAALAAEFGKLLQLDTFLQRVRERIFPKPWTRTGGTVVTGTGNAGVLAPIVMGGTAGRATIQPERCFLDGIHNPSTTLPTTISLGEMDGDPNPKVTLVIPAMGTQQFMTGLLFNKGITVLANSANLPCTFWGRTLD